MQIAIHWHYIFRKSQKNHQHHFCLHILKSEKWKLVSWWWSDKEHTAHQPATPDHSVQCHDFRFLGQFWQILSVSFGYEETSEVQSYHNTMKYRHFPFTVSHHNIKRVNSSLCLTPIVQMSLRSGSSDPHFCGHSLLVISTTSLANASLMWNGSSGREPLPWYKTHKLTWENGNLRTIKFTLHLNCIQAWFEL